MTNKIPDVVMIGMSRAGTSFMYHNLQKHPEIFLPSRKEVCYFAHNFSHGKHWYKRFFKDKHRNEIAVDICGVYFTDSDSLRRIKESNPNVKVILSIRDPYEWIFSLYEQYRGCFTVPAFDKFVMGCTIQREGQSISIDYSNQKIMKTIEICREIFGKNLMLYDFSYFKEEPLLILNEIETFAGVKKWFKDGNFTNAKINASGRKKIKWFDKLLHVKGIVQIILKILPRRFILKIRSTLEQAAVKKINHESIEDKFSKEDCLLVEKMFKQDRQYIQKLFAEKRIIFGS